MLKAKYKRVKVQIFEQPQTTGAKGKKIMDPRHKGCVYRLHKPVVLRLKFGLGNACVSMETSNSGCPSPK